MNREINLTPAKARFLDYALAALANPGAYSAATIAKCNALLDAHAAGDSIAFSSIMLNW